LSTDVSEVRTASIIRAMSEISSSHGCEYEVQNCLLGRTAVQNNSRPTFQGYVLSPSSGRWMLPQQCYPDLEDIILHGSTSQKTILNSVAHVTSNQKPVSSVTELKTCMEGEVAATSNVCVQGKLIGWCWTNQAYCCSQSLPVHLARSSGVDRCTDI
jgi:hypothetical protein